MITGHVKTVSMIQLVHAHSTSGSWVTSISQTRTAMRHSEDTNGEWKMGMPYALLWSEEDRREEYRRNKDWFQPKEVLLCNPKKSQK